MLLLTEVGADASSSRRERIGRRYRHQGAPDSRGSTTSVGTRSVWSRVSATCLGCRRANATGPASLPEVWWATAGSDGNAARSTTGRS